MQQSEIEKLKTDPKAMHNIMLRGGALAPEDGANAWKLSRQVERCRVHCCNRWPFAKVRWMVQVVEMYALLTFDTLDGTRCVQFYSSIWLFFSFHWPMYLGQTPNKINVQATKC